MRKVLAKLVVFTLLLSLVACARETAPKQPAPSQPTPGSATPQPAPKPLTKLTIGDSASITLHSLPAIAVAKGFDKLEGLELEVKTFASGAAMVESVAAGQLQVGQAGDVPFTSLAASGTPVKMIAQMTDSGANYTFHVAKDLNVRKPADILGKTIALPFGSAAHMIMNGFIDAYKLDAKQIKLVDMQPGDVPAAFTRGDVDGFILWSPGSNKAAAAKPSVKVHDGYRSYFPDAPGPMRLGTAHTVIFARDEILKSQPETIQAYLRTLLRAKKFLDDPATAAEARKLIADSLKINVALVEETKDQIIFQLDLDKQLIDDLTLVASDLYRQKKITNPPNVPAWTNTAPLAAVAPNLVNLEGKAKAGAAPVKDVGKLNVGYTPSVSIGTLLVIADAMGFDKQEGLDMTLQKFATSPVEAEATAAGQLDIGGMGDTTIIGLQAAGVPVKMIAQLVDVSRMVELICRSDRNVTRPQDLENRTVGYTFGGLAHNLVAKFISTYGLDERKVKQIDGAPATLVAGLARGDLDCIALWPPGLMQAKKQVPTNRLHNGRASFISGQEGPKNIMGSHSNLFATEKLINTQPEAIMALMRALLKAVDFVKSNPQKAAELVAADFKVEVSEMLEGFPLVDFKLTIDETWYRDMDDTAQFFHKLGRLKSAPPPMLKGWVDDRLLKQVAPNLVTFQP